MIRRFAAFACLLALGAGCSDATVTVDVFAASSLTDAFTELEDRFEAENPGVDIRLNLAGSDTLRRQIDDGATAHVFAPASIELFDDLSVDGTSVVGDPVSYASNQLTVIAVDAATADRAEAGELDGLLIARCAAGVPCGTAADTLIDALGLDLGSATVTAEANVRAVSAKVALGEADLGFVYRTDALAADGDVVVAELSSPDASVELAIAAIASDNEVAQAFVDFVVTQDQLFASLGFEPAP